MKQLICFAGAGGTGKTSLVNGLAKVLGSVEVHGSIVREFYAKAGLSSEAEFHAKPIEWRTGFQVELLEYYVERLTHKYQHTTADYLLCDRSVFDHCAYIVFGTQDVFNRDMHQQLVNQVRWFAQLKPIVLYLPYPTPWDKHASDGFRDRRYGKEVLVDGLIHSWLQKYSSLVRWKEIPTDELSMRLAEAEAAILTLKYV